MKKYKVIKTEITTKTGYLIADGHSKNEMLQIAGIGNFNHDFMAMDENVKVSVKYSVEIVNEHPF